MSDVAPTSRLTSSDTSASGGGASPQRDGERPTPKRSGEAPTLVSEAGSASAFTLEHFSLDSEAGVRRNNEDYCGYQVSPDGQVALVILSDGMGGHSSGEVASRCATDSILSAFERHFGGGGLRAVCGGDPNMTGASPDPFGSPAPAVPESEAAPAPPTGSGDAAAFEAILGSVLEAAHQDVLDEAARDEAKEGMGATIVTVLLYPGRAVVAHVGDSRAIQFRGDRVRRLTRDHLFVVDALGLSENVAKRHPQGNILSQALGARDPIQPTVQVFDAKPGDQILLCSDGVSEVIGEQEMYDILQAHGPDTLARALVAAALAARSRDNCSALVVTVP